jgi:hypothetical protein
MTFGRGWDRRADDVMTLRRAALAGVGVVAAVIGTLAVAAPAYADDVNVQLSQNSFDMSAGDTKQLTVRLENTTNQATVARVTVNSPSGLGDVQLRSGDDGCNGSGNSVSCAVPLGANKSKDIGFSLSARNPSSLQPGDTKQGSGSVQLDFGGQKSFNVTLHGPAQTQAPSVSQVSGTVRDITSGTPIKGAVVVLVDSGACAPGKEACQTGTDNSGGFRFTSRPDKPITPGSIQVGATKSGFDNGVTTVDARAGQSVTVTIKLKPNAEATSSATADPLPTLDTQGPTADAATQVAPGAAQKQASNSGPSAISWIILVLAGLLVLLGVGVFVVLFVNRKKGDAEDEEGDGPPTGPHGSPVPAGGGVYGGAPGANPTMVGGSGMTQTVMAAPGMRDAATTILHPQRPEDEFPDPYNAPYPASPAGYPPNGNGYGGGAYGATQVGGYPAAGQPGGYDPQTQPYGAQPAGYGPGAMHGGEYGGEYAQGAGYGGQGGYDRDAPAGPPPQRYDDATRAWDGPGAGGPPGYGQPAQPGGYDNGYGNGGYANGGGYQQQPAGYDPHGGYGPPADPYADQAYEHDQRGGYDPYHQQPSETPSRRAPSPGRGRGDQRLDWLDD